MGIKGNARFWLTLRNNDLTIRSVQLGSASLLSTIKSEVSLDECKFSSKIESLWICDTMVFEDFIILFSGLMHIRIMHNCNGLLGVTCI